MRPLGSLLSAPRRLSVHRLCGRAALAARYLVPVAVDAVTIAVLVVRGTVVPVVALIVLAAVAARLAQLLATWPDVVGPWLRARRRRWEEVSELCEREKW